MKLRITLLAASLTICLLSSGRECRDICKNAFKAIPDKENVFKVGAPWFPYPAYEDRAAWAEFGKGYHRNILAAGEAALKYKWQVITASEFLDCEKDGDRAHLKIDRDTKQAIARLMFAELVEGKGRFIPHLIDGMFYEAERATWQYAVHTNKQRTRKPLPDPEDRYITNGAAHTAQIMAVALYFFRKEFDKIDPTITRTIYRSLEKNIFEPFLDASKNDVRSHFWMGYGWKENGENVRNWTTHCTTQIMYCFLLCDQNQERLINGVEKGMELMDNYIDCNSLDGWCDEGPSYWEMAGAKVFEFAKLMYNATGGKFNILGDDQIRRMMAYKSKVFIGDGWEVNYADGEPRTEPNGLLMYSMGKDTGNPEMVNYGLYLLGNRSKKSFATGSLELGAPMRSLINMRWWKELKKDEEAALKDAGGDFDKMMDGFRKDVGSEWYPGPEVVILKNDSGWYLSAKGGNNGEGHNHNDVGSCILFLDECPVFLDLGCGTYNKDTFGANRYKLIQNISTGHNCPEINGFEQGTGAEFAASGKSCELAKGTFTTNIAGAYPAEAGCKEWKREYKLGKEGATITDSYALSTSNGKTDIHFMVNGDISIDGRNISIDCRNFKGDRHVKVAMNVPKGLEAKVETIKLTDIRHSKNYGPVVHRLIFTHVSKTEKSGKYIFKITRK